MKFRHHTVINKLYKATAFPAFIFLVMLSVVFACNQQQDPKAGNVPETLTSGKLIMYVDNTAQPVIEDVLAVFHNVYDRASVTQVNKTENEIVRALLSDSVQVAVLPRLLTPEEESHFTKRKIVPQVTHFATDAIALIVNKAEKDTVIELEEVLNIIRGNVTGNTSKLVFDNPNSSTMQHLMRLANIKQVPQKNVSALKSNEEVIKFVSENKGVVGVIGVNWLLQPPQSLTQYVDKVKVLAVDNAKGKGVKKYYKPNQTSISTGSYPLTRKLYVLNYQGRQALGMGFASYVYAREGQRIILKSGLLPVEIPEREVNVK